MPNAPILRPYCSDDHAAVVRLWHDGHGSALPATVVAERSLESFDRRLGPLEAGALVAKRDGNVVGVAAIESDEIDQLYMASNDRAHRFYARAGWRDGGVRQAPIRTPDGRHEPHPTHTLAKQLSSQD